MTDTTQYKSQTVPDTVCYTCFDTHNIHGLCTHCGCPTCQFCTHYIPDWVLKELINVCTDCLPKPIILYATDQKTQLRPGYHLLQIK